MRGENAASIGIDLLRDTMKTNNSGQVKLCHLLDIQLGLDGKEVGYFGEAVDEDPYRIISFW